MSTIAIFGSYVLSRRDGAQEVLRDHWVLLEGKRIAAVTRDRPSATEVFDRPGRFVLPGLLNLHNHCFSEAVARTIPRTAMVAGTTRASSIRCCCR
jgi:N-acetylglucosamine-6-phosphate deacetylase